MRLGSALALAVMLAVVGCASSERGTDVFESEGRPAGAADRAFLPGVPYVSWNEAARLWFRERDLTNPSFHASFLMVLGYWGQHWSLMDDRTALQEWGITDKGTAPSLASVKSFLDVGVPVIVPGAITPLAHFANPARAPGLLGTMQPLDARPGQWDPLLATFRVVIVVADDDTKRGEQRIPLDARPGQWDPLLATFRVVIGYDDARRVVTLHDPTFGPVWTVDYDDFDRMWSLTNRTWMVMRPHDPRPIVAERQVAPPYRERTADEQAATDLVYALALSAGGRDRAAADRRRQAPARPAINVGHRHLLRLGLAGYEMHRGRLRAAADSADEAARLVPESPAPWSLAAEAYRRLGRAQDADAAAARARQLAACSEGAQVRGHGEAKVLPEALYRPEQRALASVIARDFFVVASCPDAGVTWLLRPLP